MDVDRSFRRRLLRNDRGVCAARLPASPVLLDHRQHLLRRHVAGDDDGGVLRTVPPLEERLRVGVLVRHVLDVFDEPHRRVFVGVGLIEAIALNLEQLLERVGAVLVVFAENGARLGLEIGFRIRQMLEHVGVERDDGFQILLGEGGVVVRGIVAGARVVARARLGHDLAESGGRIVRRAAKHQVLEEVREAGFPRFHLVARAGLDRNLNADQVRKSGRHDDHLQAVGQRRFGRAKRKDVRRLRRRHGDEQQAREDSRQSGYVHWVCPRRRPPQLRTVVSVSLSRRLSACGPKPSGRSGPSIARMIWQNRSPFPGSSPRRHTSDRAPRIGSSSSSLVSACLRGGFLSRLAGPTLFFRPAPAAC